MAENVSAILARLVLLDQAKFVSGMKQASGATGELGTESEKTSKKTGLSAKSLLKWAAAAGLAYKAANYLKSSVRSVVDLGKASMALGRVTGMDVETSSKWVEMARARGVSSQQLQVAMGRLAKQTHAANAGTASAVKAFTDLGISQQLVQSGDTPALLAAIADGMAALPNQTDRAAASQALFGKGGAKLLGILGKGSAGIDENLATLTKYGDYLSEASGGAVADYAAAQREADAASRGLSLQIGQGLLPAMTALKGSLVTVLRALQPVLRLIAKYPGYVLALAGAIFVLVAAIKVYGLVQKAQAGELLVWNALQALAAKRTIIWTAAQWLLNVALSANPIALVVIAVVALIAALVLAYKKVDWFREAVQTAWEWIKGHWPLLAAILLGPFATAAYLIITNFGRVKQVLGGIATWIRSTFTSLADLVGRIFRRIVGWADAILSPVQRLVDAVPGMGGGDERWAAAVSRARARSAHALGGMVPGSGGPILVGERGPEIVRVPAGARVQPVGAGVLPASAAAASTLPPIVVEVMLDRKVLARATAQVAADRRARR